MQYNADENASYIAGCSKGVGKAFSIYFTVLASPMFYGPLFLSGPALLLEIEPLSCIIAFLLCPFIVLTLFFCRSYRTPPLSTSVYICILVIHHSWGGKSQFHLYPDITWTSLPVPLVIFYIVDNSRFYLFSNLGWTTSSSICSML